MTAMDELCEDEPVDVAQRWYATAVFLLNGLTLSTWISRMAAVKGDLGLSDRELGLAGAVFAVAAISAMQLVGGLVTRFGSPTVLRASLLGLPVLLALVGSAPSLPYLALSLAALGGAHGATDAAMNAHAVAVERRIGRPVMSGCHAAWSASVVVASLVTGATAHAGVGSSAHLAVAGAILLAAGLLLGPRLDEPAGGQSAGPARRSSLGWRNGWTRGLVALGLTGTLLMVCEGAALGWGAVLLHDDKHASLGVAALAVTAYTVGQTAGRLAGDALTHRLGARPVYRAGGVLAATGLAAAVLASTAAGGVAGFGLMGLGTATLLPLTYSAVGAVDVAADAAPLVARFTTFAYGGILLGPGLIGVVADLVGLDWTLGLLAPALLVLALAYRLPVQARA